MTTTLNVNLSPTLQGELNKPGVWAYAVYFDVNGNNPNWTPLVSNGTVQQTGATPIALPSPFASGKVYFIVQSQAATQPYNLQSLLTTESTLNWGNASQYDFSYDSFEVSLQNASGDVGNLTSVNGFGLPMGVQIAYQNGTTASVGYRIPGGQIAAAVAAINPANPNPYVYNYTSGPLTGLRMVASPTETPALGSAAPFSPNNWAKYVGSLEGPAAGTIVLSGLFNGAPDGNHVWHNGGYFAYQLSWDGTSFWLNPLPSSQIKGAIQITPGNLENSIYSTLGTANVYTQEGAAQPYSTATTNMNTGANNQWGKVLSEFFTGFTGGYYNYTGQSPNSQIATAIDLNKNLNWDPIYAFTQPSSVSNQTNDPYSKVFYFNSNSYGSNYSDALMSEYSVGGPQISVWDPTTQSNVSAINLTIYADGEQPQGYTTPQIYNYIAPAAGGYVPPSPAATANNIGLTLAAGVAQNAGVVLDSTATVTLRILTSDAGNVPIWSTVTFNGATAGPAGLWQSWQIAYNASTQAYSATPTGGLQPVGSMLIENFPTAASGVSWYQIGLGSKTFNLYTTSTGGQFENPNFAGQTGALAIDGLAKILLPNPAVTPPTLVTFTIDFSSGNTVTVDPSLLVPNTANTGPAVFKITPYAPVAGTIAGSTFTALPGQNNASANTITTSANAIAFGWTGDNNNSSTSSWISAYTNKINAGDIARVSIASSAGTSYTSATGDIDGIWQTPAVSLRAGTYTVTMTEYLPSDTAFQTPVAPASSPLVLTVTTDSAIVDLGTHGDPWPIVGVGDFFGDKTSDILWQKPSTGQVDQWHVIDARWAGSVDLGSTKPAPWQTGGIGDFNGDGTSDVLWVDYQTGQDDAWLMQNGNWARSVDLGSNKPAPWQVAGIGDFNGDGTSDVLWFNTQTLDVDEWLMSGGNWAKSIDLGAAHGPGWAPVAVGDFTGDGTSGVLFRNISTGQVDEWVMKNGNWAKSIDLGATKGADWALVGVGDFNGNGNADVMWRHTTTNQLDEWQLQGGQWAKSIDQGTISASWVATGVGDFNGDKRTDVLWADSTSGHVYAQLAFNN